LTKESLKQEGREIVPIVNTARTLVGLVQRSCIRVCKRLWQNELVQLRRKTLVMLRRSCYAGLQLEVAKPNVMGVRKVVFQHSAAFAALCLNWRRLQNALRWLREG